MPNHINPPRLITLSLLLLLHPLLQLGLAHENQLSGLLYMQPQNPIPEQPFSIILELVDPEGAYIPEAIVNLSIPNLDFKQQFSETDQVGIYTVELSLPDGKWLSNITEATFEGELNTIQFGLNVGSENREIIELLFPVMKEDTQLSRVTLLFFILSLAAVVMLVFYLYLFLNTGFHLGTLTSHLKRKLVNS